MQYVYDVMRADGTKEDTCTRFEVVENYVKKLNFIHVVVYPQLIPSRDPFVLTTQDDMDDWRRTLEQMVWFGTVERGFSKLPTVIEKNTVSKVEDAISPKHHKGTVVVPGVVELEWLESIMFHQRFKDPEKFKAAVEMQIRKYLDRNGGKDAELQELMKASWYLDFLIAFVKNDNKPIRVSEIPYILGRKEGVVPAKAT